MKKNAGLCPTGSGTSSSFLNLEHYNRVKAERAKQGLDRSEVVLPSGDVLVTQFNKEHWERVKSARCRQGLG